MGFQYKLSLEMIKLGYPITGITIAAGVPSPDKGKEIIDETYQHGIKH